jgi:hypothetical protein
MEVAEAAQTVRTRVFTLYTGSWPREYDARTVSNDQTERYRGPEAEGLLSSALDMEAATAPSSLATLQGLRETAGFRQPPSIGVSPRWADSSTLRQQFADALRKGDVHEIPVSKASESLRFGTFPFGLTRSHLCRYGQVQAAGALRIALQLLCWWNGS